MTMMDSIPIHVRVKALFFKPEVSPKLANEVVGNTNRQITKGIIPMLMNPMVLVKNKCLTSASSRSNLARNIPFILLDCAINQYTVKNTNDNIRGRKETISVACQLISTASVVIFMFIF